MAAMLLIGFSVLPGREGPITSAWADPVEVQDVATPDPERSVMVYSTPDQVLTVIWLFSGETATDES